MKSFKQLTGFSVFSNCQDGARCSVDKEVCRIVREARIKLQKCTTQTHSKQVVGKVRIE